MSEAGTTFPPRRRLAQILRSLAKHLPPQVDPALVHARFADGAAALARFADAAYIDAAVAAMPPEEAAWLADVILERWSRLATPVLDPEVAIVAPDDVWVGKEPARLTLTVDSIGIDPDWEAVWEGDVPAGPPSRTATIVVQPPSGNAPAQLRVRAHVRARANGERCILLAHAVIRVRRPVVIVEENRRRILVRDHEERTAAGVRLDIGDATHTTTAAGLVDLTQPAPAGALLRVEGIPAGRVPGA